MKTTALIIALLLLCSCASSRREPPALEPTGSAIDGLFAASHDDTRAAVVSVLAMRGIAIELDDRLLGMIATEFTPAPTGIEELACTGLATNEGEAVDGIRFRLRIEIARKGRTLTRVRVYADVQGRITRGDTGEGAWVDCTSTGEVERDFIDAVQDALSGG